MTDNYMTDISSSIIYSKWGDIGDPPSNRESSKDQSPTALKVAAIAGGIILGGLVALLVAHLGFGFPLNSLNTIGSTMGGGALGGIIGYGISKILNQYFTHQKSLDEEDGYSTDTGSEEDESYLAIKKYANDYGSDVFFDFEGDSNSESFLQQPKLSDSDTEIIYNQYGDE